MVKKKSKMNLIFFKKNNSIFGFLRVGFNIISRIL